MDNNTQGQNDKKPSLSWSQPAAPVNSAKPVSATPPTVQKSTPPAVIASEKSNMSAYVGIFVAGIVVGALIGWGITASRNGTGTVATSTPNGTESTSQNGTSNVDLSGSTIGSGTIVVASPQVAGEMVAVSNVSVAAPTWVVVYEDVNNTPGRILGAELFFPVSMKGATSGSITLLRPTVAGQSYFVGQRVDDGDKAFSTTLDMPVVDTAGSQMMTKFTAN